MRHLYVFFWLLWLLIVYHQDVQFYFYWLHLFQKSKTVYYDLHISSIFYIKIYVLWSSPGSQTPDFKIYLPLYFLRSFENGYSRGYSTHINTTCQTRKRLETWVHRHINYINLWSGKHSLLFPCVFFPDVPLRELLKSRGWKGLSISLEIFRH